MKRLLFVAALLLVAFSYNSSAQSGKSDMYDRLTSGLYSRLSPALGSVPQDDQVLILNGIGNTFTTLMGLGIANQLLLIPTVSPASGFVVREDPATGAPIRTKRGLGPIFAERAETIGKRKFFLGFAYQQINFSSLGVQEESFSSLPSAFANKDTNEIKTSKLTSLSLQNFPMIFPEQSAVSPRHPTGAQITACPCNQDPSAWNHQPLINLPQNSMAIHLSQTTAYLTAGVTNWLDASLIIPMVRTGVSYTAQSGSVVNLANGNSIPTSPFTQSASDSGIGDVTLRLKASLLPPDRRTGLAIGTDVRFPTGDETNFRGTGTAGVKPFVVISEALGNITPHANFGFQVNGNSILAGNVNFQDPSLTRKGHLPDQFSYTVGVDVDVSRSFTISADLLGQELYNTQVLHLFPDMPIGPGVQTTTPQPYLSAWSMVSWPAKYRQNVNVSDFAVGFKTLIGKKLIATGNVLFKMNNGGLRADVIPLFGLSYGFY